MTNPIPAVPETFTCPKGHTHHHSAFHCYIDTNVPLDDIDHKVVFTCPGGEDKKDHQFTLAAGIKSGMFTDQQAGLLRRGAIRTMAK